MWIIYAYVHRKNLPKKSVSFNILSTTQNLCLKTPSHTLEQIHLETDLLNTTGENNHLFF